MRPRQTTYLVTYKDKLAIGEAYYYAIEDNSTNMSKTALKCLLLIHIERGGEILPFRLAEIPYKTFWCNDTMLKGVRELVSKRYLDKTTRQTYKITDSGIELVKTFWNYHSRRFVKLVIDI
jgi:predicted transcriptional regulator